MEFTGELAKLSLMEKVTGIGGVFFKAKDPKKLLEWYRDNLGIEAPDGAAEFHWRHATNPEKGGRTVWSLFASDSDYFGESGQQLMIN